MLRASLIAVLLLTPPGLPAQSANGDEEDASLLRYRGEPLRLPFQCTAAEIADFGMTCTTRAPCPVYLDLTAVEAVNERVFVAGNFHDGSNTLFSILLASEDGGQSWKEVHERLRGVGLDLIHFHDDDNGWVTGHVLALPPRDPFFLITSDGGQHWRRRDIFSQSGIGLIDQFWFDDERSGGLLIDRVRAGDAGRRYERYETMTGGADWMIREVSAQPIRLRNIFPATPSADWRLTPDDRSGAWKVEQRQPGGWAPVSEFLIETGLCTPAPALADVADPTPEPGEPAPAAAGDLPVAPEGVFVIGGAPPPKPPEPKKPSKP